MIFVIFEKTFFRLQTILLCWFILALLNFSALDLLLFPFKIFARFVFHWFVYFVKLIFIFDRTHLIFIFYDWLMDLSGIILYVYLSFNWAKNLRYLVLFIFLILAFIMGLGFMLYLHLTFYLFLRFFLNVLTFFTAILQ